MKRPFFLRANFWYRLWRWEFWPVKLIYTPVSLYGVWLALRSRATVYFSAVNPGIPYGGLFADSKYFVFQGMPRHLYPQTLLVQPDTSVEALQTQVSTAKIGYPLIAKPDLGERGRGVAIVRSPEQLNTYLKEAHHPFLVQEYIDYPVEVGIFYYRFPNQEKGRVSSIVVKEMLEVTGNGTSTVEELMQANPRRRLYIQTLNKELAPYWQSVPEKGERLLLNPIGNHCKGTTFKDGHLQITEALRQQMDVICSQIPGFFYGRLDIRCASMQDLEAGKNFSIIEVNGAKAEPAHIYEPGYSLWKAYKVLFHHHTVMYRIARDNRRRGTRLPPAIPAWRACFKSVKGIPSPVPKETLGA